MATVVVSEKWRSAALALAAAVERLRSEGISHTGLAQLDNARVAFREAQAHEPALQNALPLVGEPDRLAPTRSYST